MKVACTLTSCGPACCQAITALDRPNSVLDRCFTPDVADVVTNVKWCTWLQIQINHDDAFMMVMIKPHQQGGSPRSAARKHRPASCISITRAGPAGRQAAPLRFMLARGISLRSAQHPDGPVSAFRPSRVVLH